MTQETRNIIELKDVIAAEFECKGCHSRITVPLDKYNGNPSQCPTCEKQWLLPINGHADQKVRELFAAMRAVAGLSPDIPIGVEVRLQISASGRASREPD